MKVVQEVFTRMMKKGRMSQGAASVSSRRLLFLFLALLLGAMPSYAQFVPGPGGRPPGGLPPQVRNVGIDQRLDAQVPLDLAFRDESGKTVRLGEYFGSKPVVLTLVYYDCPMLCTQILNGVVGSLKALKFEIGNEFNVVTVSFNPKETSDLAASKKQSYLTRYGRPGAEQGWHFLTGDQSSIDSLCQAVGYRYQYDPATQQYAHASGIMVLTPQGKVSKYFYGIEYAPRDLRLGLIEASASKIGTPVDQVLLYCFHYDPSTGKYGAVVMNIVRLAAILTIAGMIILVLLMRKRFARQAEVKIGGAA